MTHARHPAAAADVNAVYSQNRIGWVEREIQKPG